MRRVLEDVEVPPVEVSSVEEPLHVIHPSACSACAVSSCRCVCKLRFVADPSAVAAAATSQLIGLLAAPMAVTSAEADLGNLHTNPLHVNLAH